MPVSEQEKNIISLTASKGELSSLTKPPVMPVGIDDLV